MNLLQDLFASPEWHAFGIDLRRRILSCAQLSPEAYHEYIFLGTELALRRGDDVYELRLDDVLLAAAGAPMKRKPIVYILHTAFCCSTLLARYFELIPSCVVMKEPQLLAQMGTISEDGVEEWRALFCLSVQLLSRTYRPEQLPVIKTHVPTNILGHELLEDNANAVIIFLLTPLRDFLLSVLKSRRRRCQVRSWNLSTATRVARRIPQLAAVSPHELTDGEAAAYWWLVNCFLCNELISGRHQSRVLAADGTRVAECPEKMLPAIMELCGLRLDESTLQRLTHHPMVHKYSKDSSLFYDSKSRRQDMAELEMRYAHEADKAVAWALRHELDITTGPVANFAPTSPLTHYTTPFL